MRSPDVWTKQYKEQFFQINQPTERVITVLSQLAIEMVYNGPRIASEIIKIAVGLIDNPEKSGGYLSVISLDAYPFTISVPIGEIPENKVTKYSELSLEKMNRLREHPDHSTSYESRDPEAEIMISDGRRMRWGRWGGAIRAGMFLLSLSGLPELWDEAFVFAFAIRMRFIKKSEVLDEISSERNPHLRPLLEKCGL